MNDYYNQALKDIDTKNYNDLSNNVSYLINYYPNKEGMADLCDKVVKIVEENKDNSSLALLLDKIQRNYPNNEYYKKVNENITANWAAKYYVSQAFKLSTLAPVKPAEPYEVTNLHSFNQNGVGYAMGNLKNTSGKRFLYVQVDINLYDKNNNQVGSTIDSTTNLEDGLTWIFNIFRSWVARNGSPIFSKTFDRK